VRALAVDWSGARSLPAQRRGIWIADAEDGALRSLVGGLTRAEAIDEVLRRVDDGAALAGFDFSFSFPAWFVTGLGVPDGPGLWAVAGRDGERWLDTCEPPFWGRPGRPRPPFAVGREEWRRTELDVPIGGRRPKGSFQIGGAGAVGTASIRGMPQLARLRAAGMAVWPFDEGRPGGPVVAEVYPRWWTGPVIKRRVDARARHLTGLGIGGHSRAGRGAATALVAVATASENAFDATCAALGLSLGGWRLTPPDALDRIEGRILGPPARR
jgi:hypothetical protein